MILGVWLFAGCPHGAEAGSPGAKPDAVAPAAVTRLAKPHHSVVWTENLAFGALPSVTVRIQQDWSAAERQGERVTYVLTEQRIDAEGAKVRDTTRVFYGPEGYGYLEAQDSAKTWLAWDPPQVVLPVDPSPGTKWTASHTRAGKLSERSCEIMPNERCLGGVISVCESKSEAKRRVFRDFFCPDIGWTGFEALQVAPEGQVRIWSTDVVIDGQPVAGG